MATKDEQDTEQVKYPALEIDMTCHIIFKDQLPGGETEVFIQGETTMCRWNPSYYRENTVFSQLSRSRRRRRDTLFGDYSTVLGDADVFRMFSNIQQRKRELESSLRDFKRTWSGFKSQIEEKEIKDAHHGVEEARDGVMTSFEETCGELKKVLQRMEEDSEKYKPLCPICAHHTRDTLILPCMHYVYCNGCLVAHQRNNNTCRGSITALLLCKLDIE